ncbi:MAG: threonine--tRNA ligase [Kiritimatiellae bacterium]|nr:threonine--tRNA ligase [Kiritimatiellia bacterium]
MRHSAAHVMAAAVCRLYKDVKIDIGPATADGFYYDFDLEHRFTPDDFAVIEAEMRKIIAEDLPFVRKEVSREEAKEIFKDQPFKLERLADIPEGATVSIYETGDYVDLCRGPHVESSGKIGAVKILSTAGSYYRGDENNQMLQRLYGMAEATQKDIDDKLAMLEEAKKRDHRRLGKELDLYSVSDAVGPGLALWHPKGARIRIAIEDYWRKEHFKAGYKMVFTPHIGRSYLWETSGHLGFYKESMFPQMSVAEGEGDSRVVEPYYVKPMNCPFHIEIYRTRRYSYRDLPLRFAELGTVYRYEKEGVRHGLLRVRGFTQDDAHIFCTPEQIVEEIKFTVNFALRILHRFGFTDITAYLSTRPEHSVGPQERWEQATESLRAALDAEGIHYEVDEGGGAFYGPKIDLKIKDALGRPWQLGTVQFDFNLPERFKLTYIGEDGKEHQPYMVHRALLGSLERFFGILIEHYGGAFPTWLAPEQVRILPITSGQMDAAVKLRDELLDENVRVEIDTENDKLGAKIRRAQLEKVPFMLILGKRDVEAGVISVRNREEGDLGAMPYGDFLAKFKESLKA